MEEPSDLALVDRAQRSPEAAREAFGQLVARYEKPLFNFILRTVRSRALAEEMFQETFLRAYRALPQFQPTAQGASVRAWLYRIAVNLCRDEVRSSRYQTQAAYSDEVSAKVASEAPSPEQRAQAQQRAALVRAALAELTETQREVLVLFQYQGLSYPEIAETLGVPLGTVKSRMHAALLALGKRLAGRPELTHPLEQA
jgi:RNA polymerase sigma-70 factor (ECF subfamily)